MLIQNNYFSSKTFSNRFTPIARPSLSVNKSQVVNYGSQISFSAREKYFYVQMSKKMAYALRHKPEECGLKLDKDGFTSVDGVLGFLRSNKGFGDVTMQDINDMMATLDKKRFELKDNNIRAYYGHSCLQKIEKIASKPPEVLYHGTSRMAAEKILNEGITPQSRQFVHMSSDIETATKVGKRYDKTPVILAIDTQKADRDGLKFYLGNQTTWLSEYIPPEYISILK